MPATARCIAVFVTFSLLTLGQSAVASSPRAVDYHGWHIDISNASGQAPDAVTKSIQKQIDGIETLGIAQDIVSFMRTVPLHVEGALDAKKPVLLQPLLRAFQEQKLKGDDVTVITSAYKQARDSGAWPANAPMLKSPQDFFAATATVYLFGDIDTEPFSRGRLHETQPEYWKWLGGVFDGFHGCESVQ